MEFAEYKSCVEQMRFGKRLPGAVYVLREENNRLGEPLDALIERLVRKFEISAEFNVIKFRTDELKVSFLAYPDFLTDAHPALRHAITVDLVTGKARHTDYADNINPPILHRKESFVPARHPRRDEFEALTRAEEEAGALDRRGDDVRGGELLGPVDERGQDRDLGRAERGACHRDADGEQVDDPVVRAGEDRRGDRRRERKTAPVRRQHHPRP